MRRFEHAVPWETNEDYFFTRLFTRLARMEGIVEEFLEADRKTSPIVQLRVDPHGAVVPISTHDQVLGDIGGQAFLGFLFPAAVGYRLEVLAAVHRIGEVLADQDVVSRFSVDFLATRADDASPWSLHGLEINLRMGGTTHPGLALQFLSGGRPGPGSGLFFSPRGHPEFAPRDRQPEGGGPPGPASRGPDRDPDDQRAPRLSQRGAGRPLPPHRRPLPVRENRRDRDRQQP